MTRETINRVNEYLAQRGPTSPWRIARDLEISEEELLDFLRTTALAQWEPREPIAGPGQNYLVRI